MTDDEQPQSRVGPLRPRRKPSSTNTTAARERYSELRVTNPPVTPPAQPETEEAADGD
jgi:hypothetical protein